VWRSFLTGMGHVTKAQKAPWNLVNDKCDEEKESWFKNKSAWEFFVGIVIVSDREKNDSLELNFYYFRLIHIQLV
jgi:hypothetical protein